MRYQHVAHYLMNSIWAIYPPKLAAMIEALSFLAAGGEYSPAEIQAIVGARPSKAERQQGTAVAVMPLRGVISHHADIMVESSGGTSIDSFTAQFREFLADPRVGAIILDINSPGGNVQGVEELSAEIYDARKTKPIVASVNAMAASAAYWIASAASEISVTPSGEVGSIGVIAAHEDMSGQMAQDGIATTLITAGKYKAEANPYQPLTEEARAYIQSQVDDYYGMFIKAVARGRDVTQASVRAGYGEGRMVLAKDALRLGMVDRIETMDETLKRLSTQRDGAAPSPTAKIEELPMVAKIEEPRGMSIVQEREWLDLQRLR